MADISTKKGWIQEINEQIERIQKKIETTTDEKYKEKLVKLKQRLEKTRAKGEKQFRTP